MVFVKQRLLPAVEINYCQAAVTEPDPGREMKAFAIRTAMHEYIRHPAQQLAIDFGSSPRIKYARQAAHSLYSPKSIRSNWRKAYSNERIRANWAASPILSIRNSVRNVTMPSGNTAF